MNFGFNSNIQVGGSIYHVQTEDRGASHPYLDTVVYAAGRVIYKRSTRYEDVARDATAETLPEKLRERIARQHREVIDELEAGTLAFSADRKTATEACDTGSEGALDVRLANPKNWFAAGKVALEIELCDRKFQRPVGDANVQVFLEIEQQRIPCAETRTDQAGRAMLAFLMPTAATDGSFLVVRANDANRYGELRFLVKAKPREKTPLPVSR